MFNVYGNLPFANSDGPLSAPGALDTYLPVGSTQGGGTFGYRFVSNLGSTVREVYVGTWWKMNPEFAGYSGLANKMIWLIGPTDNANYLNWWGTENGRKRLMWVMQQGPDNCHVSGYIHNPADPCSHGTFQPNGPHDGYVSAGSGWHRIEIYQKSSTTATSRDGILGIWIDGILSTYYKNVNLAPEGFSEMQYNHTWDGGPPCDPASPKGRDCTKEWHHYWDHLRISIPHNAPPLTQILTTISVTPDRVTVLPLATQQFAATGLDQYGIPMAPQPVFSWTVNGGGTINASGLFAAGAALGGPHTVMASANGKFGITQFSVGEAVGKNAFMGTYFRNMDLTGPILTRIDNSINFEWGYDAPDPTVPADSFSVRWEGEFTFPVAGTYPFSATVDDGIRIYVDGTKILDQWKNQTATTYTVNQSVTAGTHRIRVEYYDYKYDAVAKISFFGAMPAGIAAAAPKSQGLGLTLVRNSGKGLEFAISAPSAEAFTLQIRDMMGREIWATTGSANVRKVVCKSLNTSGLYFATLKQGRKQTMHKIAVMR